MTTKQSTQVQTTAVVVASDKETPKGKPKSYEAPLPQTNAGRASPDVHTRGRGHKDR